MVDPVYISRTFTAATTTHSGTQNARRFRRGVKNELAFSLGVALIELSWGKSLLSFKTDDDLNEHGVVDSATEYIVARRLADELHRRESTNYAEAVARCISCNFDTSTYEFEGKEFRERFYESVVLPLQNDYEFLYS